MKVQVFIPCSVDQFRPETGMNTVRVLQKAGCTVQFNPAQTCCGQAVYQAGFWNEAKRIGQKLLHDLSGEVPVVSPSAACTGMVRRGFDDLFTNTADHNRCRTLQSQLFELSEFLVQVLNVDYFGAELEAKAVFVDSCTGTHTCGIRDEPRQLLQKVAGLELVEPVDAGVCCGFGGNFSHKFPELSSAMAAQKVQHALSAGAELLISTDVSCLMHLQSYITKQSLPLRTFHLADVLCHGWPNI